MEDGIIILKFVETCLSTSESYAASNVYASKCCIEKHQQEQNMTLVLMGTLRWMNELKSRNIWKEKQDEKWIVMDKLWLATIQDKMT